MASVAVLALGDLVPHTPITRVEENCQRRNPVGKKSVVRALLQPNNSTILSGKISVRSSLQNPSVIAQASERALGGKWLPQELQARRETFRKALSSLGAQMERLTEAYLAGVIPLEEYRRRRQELADRFATLDKQNHLLEEQAHQHREVIVLAVSMTEFCQRIALGLEQATFEQKRQLIELLIDRVVVTMEEVEIRYVIPTSSRSEHLLFCHLHSDYFRGKAKTFVKGSRWSRC